MNKWNNQFSLGLQATNFGYCQFTSSKITNPAAQHPGYEDRGF